MSFEELTAEALKLSPEDQQRLLHQLACALDDEEEPELTNEELEKRWAEFQAVGMVSRRPSYDLSSNDVTAF